MPSDLSATCLSALMLAALLLCARGASIASALAEDSSGDGAQVEEKNKTQEKGASLEELFNVVIGAAQNTENTFDPQFCDNENTHMVSSLPAGCHSPNFSKEACLQRLAKGLQTYVVLLRYTESWYPSNSTVSQHQIGRLIGPIKAQMKNSTRVKELTSSEEKQLLSSLDKFKDEYSRKLTACKIVQSLHEFLSQGVRKVRKRVTRRASLVTRSTSPLHHQLIKDSDNTA